MANYPLPKFHFLVQWGGERIGFTEVTGLDIQIEAIEYREGSSPEYSKIKMPGMHKYSNITLKRGSMSGDSDFYKWINTTALNTVERRDIIISLLNETISDVPNLTIGAYNIPFDLKALKTTANVLGIKGKLLKYPAKLQDIRS